jgi:small subunit ribosomal protein S6
MSETTQAPATETAAPAKPLGTKLREYETLFCIKPDLPDETTERLVERLKGVITREGGRVIRVTYWGKKKTAYAVAHSPRAFYLHFLYLGPPGIAAEFERNLKITEEVWKYQTVKIAEDVNPDARPTEQDVRLAGDVDQPTTPPREDEEMGGMEDDMGGEEPV